MHKNFIKIKFKFKIDLLLKTFMIFVLKIFANFQICYFTNLNKFAVSTFGNIYADFCVLHLFQFLNL